MGNTIPIPESLQEEGEDGLPRTPRLAGFMQSTNMDSIDDTFGSSKGTPKEKLLTCIATAKDLLNKIKAHDAYKSLHKLITSIKASLEDIYKDKMLKMKGGNDTLIRVLEGINKTISTCRNKFCDLIDSHQDDISAIDVTEYFAIRDEAEIILHLHLSGITMYKKYLTDQRIMLEREKKRQKQNKRNRGRSIPLLSLKQVDLTQNIKDDKLAKDFWKDKVGIDVFSVAKDAFIAGLKEQFKDKEWLPELDVLIDPTSDGVVTISDFITFLDWFGPFENCFENVATLCKCPFFWGSMSSIQAQQLLDKQKLGTFIVRFNETVPGQFCISCVEEEESQPACTLHFRVFRKKYKFMLTDGDPDNPTIQSIIDKYCLSFRYPFEDESQKPILKISNKEKPSLRISLNGLDIGSEEYPNFADFRGKAVYEAKKRDSIKLNERSSKEKRVSEAERNRKSEKASKKSKKRSKNVEEQIEISEFERLINNGTSKTVKASA